MKKRFWILHSWLGLIAGIGLLVIGVSGSLLVFRDQLDKLVSPELMRVEPLETGRLPWDRLLSSAQQAWPNFEVTGMGVRRDPALADLAFMIEKGDDKFRAATIDPYTGKALGNPVDPSQTFTGILLELHYTWFADHVGMLVTGSIAVALCLLGVTGVWLYRDFWKNLLTLRWGRSARVFFSDAHKMIGISSVAFNLILGFTGAYWNISHVASEGLSHDESESPKMTNRQYSGDLSLDALITEARSRMPGFETHWISLPFAPGGDITLWGKVPTGNVLAGDYGSTAVFDAQTGALKSYTDIRDAGWWTKIQDTFMPLHYGTFGGWPVKILWCIGGLTPGMLAVSGFLIWRSRQRKPRSTPVKAGAGDDELSSVPAGNSGSAC